MGKQSAKKKKAALPKKRAIEKDNEVSSFKQNPYVKTPLYDLLHVFERAPDQWAARYILILSAILLRSAVGLGPWSGKGEEPINGDFEAQRHWMEITTHLPINQWYFYDLQYWGLDYPPITAYHLWLCGIIGNVIDSSWFELDKSRAIETPAIKTFMRYTSLVSELTVLFPATLQLVSLLGGKKLRLGRMHQIVVIAVLLMQPALVLIDHGHFQFNSVMLGFFLFSVSELLKDNLMMASVWFVASIMFKQMALYYSPFIFFYILSKLFTPQSKLSKTIATFDVPKLIAVGATVVISIMAILLPFFVAAQDVTELEKLVRQIVIRMFPFERGLFEDKVANFWCVTNVIFKYREHFTAEQLKVLSLALTVLSILPACLITFWKNITRKSTPPTTLIYGFSATAWGFYLFSFQVHEKTVLVPLIPSTFLLLLTDPNMVGIIQWINNISCFSMYPLLKKDGLVLQYFTLTLLINWLVGGFSRPGKGLLWPETLPTVIKLVVITSYIATVGFHAVDYFFDPPASLPDLWVIINCVISFGCFSFFFLWLNYSLLKL